MPPDQWSLYSLMLKSRLLEEAVVKLWHDGLISGEMHLFSKEHLAASSGIVGASGPAASGFALSAQYLRPGAVAVAFFGEGVMRRERESGGFRLPTQDVPGRSECRMSFSATNGADRYTLSGGHFELA